MLAFFLLCSFLALPAMADGKHDLSFKVSRGDTFYKFFFIAGLSGNLLTKLMTSSKTAQRLNNIFPGDKFRITLDDNHDLEKIIFSPINSSPLSITYENKKFRFDRTSALPTGGFTHTLITIKKSLNYDAKKAGIEAEVTKMMVDNFSWEIDFSRDLRRGDKFILSWDGEKTPCSMIYVGGKRTIALFAYTNSLGEKKYFTSKGATLNDTFGFAPTKYDRISSGFQKSRYHPTLRVYRSHRGTDFASPTGTPVHATAKGIVKYTATLTGYGNVVYLKHGSEYLTVYAHLSKFAKGLKSGDKVSKGQLIGYVGTTGQSTGPHLHYELRINGVHQDAEKVKPPKQSFVPSNKMSEFQARAKQVLIDLGV